MSKPRFRATVNSGQGNLNIRLKARFDSPPSWASLNNFIKVYWVKVENGVQTDGLLYTGFITRVEHVLRGSSEFMNVSTLALGSLTSLALYKDGSSFDVVKTSVDPAVIATDIVTKANTQIGGSWLSSGSNVVNVGTTVSYIYEKSYWFEALNETLSFTGGNYYWYIDESGELYFKPYGGSPDHKFNITKNVNEIIVENNAELITNESSVFNGTDTYSQTDATSITNYFKRDEWKNDENLDAVTAGQYVNGRVANNKDSKIQVLVEINTSYDLESIRPGQTCSFFGLDIGSTLLGSNMKIVSVEYNEDTVTLGLSEDFGNFGEELTKYLNNKL